ncbi:MAG: Papain-like cysteine protease AvrRpt2 [Herbinix sp.]|jgi:hypothetical protein|nr:Papain-like cysteine protease AvrRpt2 [Herbinix sp.]
MIKSNLQRRGYIYLALILALVLFQFVPNKALASEDKVSSVIPKSATQFVDEKYKDIMEVVKSYKSDFNVKSDDLNNITVGEPFVIYDLDQTSQDEIYYYPVLNGKNKVILNLSITGTTNGWGLSASEEMVKELNKIDYTTEDYIFYESNDNIIAESSDEVINLSGIESEKCRKFQAYDFHEKEKIISGVVKKFLKTDPSDKKHKNMSKDKYTPSYSESTNTSKVCSLYNSKGQGSYADCWAAVVATIANYRNGTNITPTQVCDFMNIGYNDGGDTYDAQSALSHYGVYLNEIFAPLSWSSITYNLDNKYPSYASCKDNYGNGHAITVYGYTWVNVNQFIRIWNPGLNSGSGGFQVIYYYPTGTTISYNNKTWTWTYSLCWIYLG